MAFRSAIGARLLSRVDFVGLGVRVGDWIAITNDAMGTGRQLAGLLCRLFGRFQPAAAV